MRIALAVPAGGAGLTTLYFNSDGMNVAAVVTAAKAFAPLLVNKGPIGMTATVPNSGDIIDEATGQLTGSWAGGTGATFSSPQSAGAVFAAGTGGLIRWNTAGVVRGRKVQGRTFVCPLIGTMYDGNGTLDDTQRSLMQTTVNDLVTSGYFRIWHRPSPAGVGSSSAITAGTVQDRVTSLRSRRR